jgi:Uma2 family endonuclease
MITSVDPPRTTVRPYRFTSSEVKDMLRAGILHEDDRLELIDGLLVPMGPIGSAHYFCVNRCNHFLGKHTPDTVSVSIQNPLHIDAHNEPEPDVVLIDGFDVQPTPETTLLVVEVSDTTLAYDRDIKLPLYAEAGLPEVWIVNLQARQVAVYREPKGTAYGLRRLVDAADMLSIETLPDAAPIAVSDIFPDRDASTEDA